MAKKNAPVVADDEIETLDEEETTEEETPAKKKRVRKAKAEKVELEGLTSKEAAALLEISPVKLRRILRTDDFFNDKGYTRYRLSDEDIERVRAAISAGATAERKPRGRKAKKVETEEAAAVADELDDLEDLEDDDLDPGEDDEE